MDRVKFYLVREFLDTETEPTPLTLIQINTPTHHRITVLEAWVCLRHNAPAVTPYLFEWCVQDAAITTPDTITAQKQDRDVGETIQGTFYTVKTDGTSDESGITHTVLTSFAVHQQGYLQWRPYRPIVVAGNERVGLRYKGATLRDGSVALFCEQ